MNGLQTQGWQKQTSSLALFHLGSQENKEVRHEFMPVKYCMCLGCGQEQWGDAITTTVPDCFACRRTGKTPNESPPKSPNPDNKVPTPRDDIFLGALRKSRGSSGADKSKSPNPDRGRGNSAPEGVERLPLSRAPSQGRLQVADGATSSSDMRRFRSEDFDMTLLRQSRARGTTGSKGGAEDGADGTGSRSVQGSRLLARRTVDGYDPQAAAANSNKYKMEEKRKKLNEVHRKEGTGSQGLAPSMSLPDIGSASPPKPSGPAPTGNEMLDAVLGKLKKPKLLEALDRLVKEVNANKRTLRGAFQEFDLNGDGILSKEEMAIGLRRLGVSLLPSELDAVMRAFDVDQNGSVEVEEFIEIMTLYRAHFKLEMPPERDRPDALPEKGRRGPAPLKEKKLIIHPGQMF